MLKEIVLLSGVAVLFVLAMGRPVSSQQSLAVGVFDFQRTLEGSAEGKRSIAQIQMKEQTIVRELGALDQQIQALEGKQKTQKPVLSFEAQQLLSLDLDNLRIKRRRVEEDGAKEYQQLQFTLVGKLKHGVLPVVASVAREKGFSLILEVGSSGVAYFDQALDITAEVIKRHDQGPIVQ